MTNRQEDATFVDAAREKVTAEMAFVRLSPELTILEISNNLNSILRSPTFSDQFLGKPLTDAFVEFVGVENHIQFIGQEPNRIFKLERINRPLDNDQVLYLDLTLMSFGFYQSNAGRNDILLTIEDASRFGRLEQAIVQERNELRLVKRKLANANARLRHLDQLKSLFFSMAAHDLRSPLMVIKGYTELLLGNLYSSRSPSDPINIDTAELKSSLDTIRVQSEWLDTIVHNVLQLYKIENNQLQLDLSPTNLTNVLTEITDVMTPMASLFEHTILFETDRESVLINGSEDHLKNIFQNLIGNAIKYMPPGGRVKISIAQTDTTAKVQVIDTGQGLTNEQLKNIFQLFYRAENVQTSRRQGTGIGLFIVSMLVDRHNGTIDVESTKGKGTTFTVTLPLLDKPTPSP